MRVVTERVPGSHTFSIGFFIDVGSRHEVASLHGASHFLEHVLFKGTNRRGPEEISAAIESVGGDINAYTAKEHTCFYARVLAEDADLAVDVLTDMLTDSLVLSREVDAEREVILDEISMHSDDPGETATELVTSHLFGEAALGLPVIGSQASIRALSRQQIVRHWRRHYQPSSMVVSAAGDVEHERLCELLAGFGTGRDGSRRRSAPSRINTEPALLTRSRNLEQCSAVLALASPGIFDDRRYPLGLLSLIVGGGMSSRLFVEIRERRGLTYGIDAGETAYSDAGLWSVDWQCAPDKLADILSLVKATLNDVAEHGVTGAELRRAKGQMRGQTALAFEGAASRMSRLGSSELIGDRRTLGDILDRFDQVSAEDVQREAGQLFGQPPVLGLVGPKVPRRPLQTILKDWPG
nr:pitrilysin family protein [Microlunatus panaciterrae]